MRAAPMIMTVFLLQGIVTSTEAFETAADVIDSIRASVRRCHPAVPDERVTVRPLAPLDSLAWDEADEIIALEAPTHPCRIGRITYLVKLRRGGRTAVRPLGVEVRREIHGLVLTRDLARGETVTPAEVSRAWVDATYRRDTPLTDAGFLEQVSMKRGARVGDCLTREMLVPAPVVRTGETVKVVYDKNGFRITLDGIARSDGRVGERIRVKNPDSGALLRVTVVAPGVVRL